MKCQTKKNKVNHQNDDLNEKIIQRELRSWMLEKDLILHLQFLSREIAARGNELASLLTEHWDTWDLLNAILEKQERDIVKTYNKVYDNTLSNWGERNDEIEAFLNHLLKTRYSEKQQ
ncbi:hypothetical protein C7H19_24425 [Aphanothece hegewaldii CCALA 016]|uniref:Uncharacterized protein n=1 Tax=Aphanothece hegewaldii CCALA 016 TaxID=2107694 RepID=A0A2T1LQN5_9CHRO|nr:hypothetical protein [Aphanothece hegewaldii]PSF29172.1 hypothetical protein C7H19_24425 [Aphanothece hegewaldii CCALA 016]